MGIPWMHLSLKLPSPERTEASPEFRKLSGSWQKMNCYLKQRNGT